MGKFKVGDRVRRLVKSHRPSEYGETGREYVVKERVGDTEDYLSECGITIGSPFFCLCESNGPVQVRTVKEIVPGPYGILRVGAVGASGARVPLSFDMEGDRFYDATEITAAIEALTAIRDALVEAA